MNRLVDDLGTFGCMDDKEPKKTPEDRIREVYQWLTNSKGCGEASEYFKELLEILDKSDTEGESIRFRRWNPGRRQYLLEKIQAATGNKI